MAVNAGFVERANREWFFLRGKTRAQRQGQNAKAQFQRNDAELCAGSITSAKAAVAHEVAAEEIHWS